MYLIHDNSYIDNEFADELYYKLEEIFDECSNNIEVLVGDANLSWDKKYENERTYNKAIRKEGKIENKYFSAYNEEGKEILPKSVKELVLAAHKNPGKNIRIDTGPILNPHFYGKFISQNKELSESVAENNHNKKADLMLEIAEYIKSIDLLTKNYIEREIQDPDNTILLFGPVRNLDYVLQDDYEIIEKNDRKNCEINESIRKFSIAMH